MKHKLISRILLGLAGVLALIVAGCGGGGGGGGSSGSSAPATTTTTDYAPDSIPSGASMSINPTIQFLDSSTIAYSNTAGGSAFTSSLVNVRYTYTPLTGGPATATLAITGDAPTDGKIFSGSTTTNVVLTFLFSNHTITGATAQINGATYNVVFSGTPLVAGSGKGGSSGGGTGGGGATGPGTGSVQTKVIAAQYEGTYALNYRSVSAGGPYKDGDAVSFQVRSDTLSFNGQSVASPVLVSGQTSMWNFTDASSGLVYTFYWTASDSSVSVSKGGQLLGVFSKQSVTTNPSGTVYGPLNGKVHHVVCEFNDDPNKPAVVGQTGTLIFSNTDPANGAYDLEAGSYGYMATLGGVKSNADGSQWSISSDGVMLGDSSVTTHQDSLVLVNVSTHTATGFSLVTKYSRNGVLFRTGTIRFKVLYTDTP